MSASRYYWAPLRAAMLAALLLATGCDDPTHARTPPRVNALSIFLVLDPDSLVQPLLAYPTNSADVIQGLSGTVHSGGALVASGSMAALPSACTERYWTSGSAGLPRCVPFQFSPRPGATYRVSVSGEGYPAAAATATVPGEFQVREVVARGTPPGTEELRVSWTPSKGAYRYVVALRPQTAPRCVRIRACTQGWYAATTDTVLQTRVPASELQGGEGAWFVDVYAMDRAVYEYLTTGSSGNLFPVPPVQNVEGGYGAVGAWVRRSRLVVP